MADWKSLADPKLKAEFEKAGPDPKAGQKARAKFIKGLDTALAQFGKPEPSKGKKSWKVANNIVEYSPSLGRDSISLGGSATHYVPAERFEAFLSALKASANAGEFDADLSAPVSSAKATGPTVEKRTRNLSPESKLNIRVGGFRRGGKSDAEIRSLLKAEGVDEAAIKKAIAYKKA